MESAQTDALGHRRGKKRGDEEWFGPMRMNREGDSAKAASTAASAARPDATPPTKFDEPARMPTPSGGSATSGTGAGTTVTPAIATSGARPHAGDCHRSRWSSTTRKRTADAREAASTDASQRFRDAATAAEITIQTERLLTTTELTTRQRVAKRLAAGAHLYIITGMWRHGMYQLFKCPLCGSKEYVQVQVRKQDGNWYLTEFYQCFHCTVMFHDPVLFTQQNSSSPNAHRGPGGAHSMSGPTTKRAQGE